MTETNSKFRRIGAGFCGTVWAADTSTDQDSAFKREDGGPDRSLANDSQMHQRIQSAMKRFITNLHRFPEGYKPCNTIQSQRIPAVTEKTRTLLTAKYCPPELVSEIMNSATNRDCLIRPYLGRRRISRPSRFKAFSLRNYPLHVDQMEELGIPEGDILGYARAMAGAMAVMHLVAGVDGNDVEFVLAAPNDMPKHNSDPEMKPWSNVLGEHEMWMLDFDLVRDISMDEEGVKQAVAAFLKNEPFCPKPDADPKLWAAFRDEYLNTSRECIEVVLEGKDAKERQALPELFIRLLEKQT